MSRLAVCVHRSFRRVEACAEYTIGAAGPLFIFLCSVLVGAGAWCFFLGVLPSIAPLPSSLLALLHTRSTLHILLGLPSALVKEPAATLRCVLAHAGCGYIITSIAVHYLHAIREAPGSVLSGLSEARHERRLGAGSEAWWVRKRRAAARASAAFSSDAHGRGKQASLPLAHASDAELDEACESDDLWPSSKMCLKCKPVPLWQALAALPPQLRQVELDVRRTLRPASSSSSSSEPASATAREQQQQQRLQHSEPEEVRGATAEEIREALGDEAENLVPPPKPERAHHCRTCGTCALKYDHHCPWLNACVGLGNERHFVLFMLWLATGMGVVVATSWGLLRRSFNLSEPWNVPYIPRFLPLLTFVLCAIMGFALAIMAGWQLLLIVKGETSVEANDNAHYREVAKRRGRAAFVNVYDVGRTTNLKIFFNAGAGMKHGWLSVLSLRRVEPHGDGWHWSKRLGMGGRHEGIRQEEELTDDEEEPEERLEKAEHVGPSLTL